ncbi:D-inositol-3-phosphate glycosyltransferase [Methylobacterium goesingense]|uniref:Glycosyltransferase involved in cell wall biosynthesis n=1 Tax=Methylobacterium goesingense TaxID=243690 RepID=A0ABV2KYZ7_9HYPH|nr:D-inositol-3-phosphate glycosyltransferase [Methylobacterium goesingense]
MSRPLRVLSIAHAAVSREAGRLRYAPFGGRTDLDVHLVVPRRWHQFGRAIDADPPDDPGIRVHVLPTWLPKAGPMGWYLHIYPGLRGLIRTLRPDVVHLWEEPWSFVALQASLLRGPAGMVLEVDQNILKRLPPPFEAIRRFTLARTAHVLARSPDATAVVRAGGYAGAVTPIGYGVDTRTFRPRTESGPSDVLRLGYVGRLVVEKGLDDVLDAMARSRVPTRLAIMGEGPHAPHLRRRIAELGLERSVTFAPWAAPAEVARFFHACDAVVLATRTTGAVREQFGRVIIEAQACGVPVIGSTCGAIPSVVGPGGWIVPESDPEAMARLLERIAADPGERSARGRAGLRNVAERFTYEAVADALAQAWLAAASAVSPSNERLTPGAFCAGNQD